MFTTCGYDAARWTCSPAGWDLEGGAVSPLRLKSKCSTSRWSGRSPSNSSFATPRRSAENKIRHIIRGAVILASEQQRALTLLLRVYGNTDAERRATGRRRALTNELHELFAASAAEGTLRNDLDPWLAARFTFGLVNSLVEWYRPGGEISPEGLADAVLAYVRTGLRMSETGDFR